jgi:hypothetical protein
VRAYRSVPLHRHYADDEGSIDMLAHTVCWLDECVSFRSLVSDIIDSRVLLLPEDRLVEELRPPAESHLHLIITREWAANHRTVSR